MARRDSILVSRTLYQMGYVTLVASILWVGVGIYNAANQNLVSDVDKAILEPVNPSLDADVIQAMSNRLKVEVDLRTTDNSTASASPSATIDTSGAR